MSGRAAGIVLAAGLGRRFGGDKLAATLDGRTLLQRVIDAAAGGGLGPLIVVVSRARKGVDWRGARLVVNDAPERGLARSLQLGVEALVATDGTAERAVVLLADQPLVAGEAIARLLAEPADADRPIVAARHADGHVGPPVMLERAAWPLARSLSGDAGMRQLFGARPELVRYVDVPGSNPDVDTPTDLVALERRDA